MKKKLFDFGRNGKWNNRQFPAERFFAHDLMYTQIDRLTSSSEKKDGSGDPSSTFKIHDDF